MLKGNGLLGAWVPQLPLLGARPPLDLQAGHVGEPTGIQAGRVVAQGSPRPLPRPRLDLAEHLPYVDIGCVFLLVCQRQRLVLLLLTITARGQILSVWRAPVSELLLVVIASLSKQHESNYSIMACCKWSVYAVLDQIACVN
jgi:hypothetical protein